MLKEQDTIHTTPREREQCGSELLQVKQIKKDKKDHIAVAADKA